MSDSAMIAYLSNIDFSMGFKRFHVKWPLTDLTKPKWSSIFETTVIDGDRRITLKWSLSVEDFSDDSTDTWFGAYLQSPGKITPMIYRICLSSSTNVLFSSTYFKVMNETQGTGRSVPSTEVNAFPIDDLMLQLWIDIPNAIAIGKNSDKLKEVKGDTRGQNLHQKTSTELFVSDASKMFNRVVGVGPDPSSDFTVIIVNKEEEELRRFNCHTIFLSSRCDVFERMFASEKWKENSDGRSVKIKDISAQVMETVLKYIYTSMLPDSTTDHDDLCGIIFAADKYNLKELMNWCVGVLILKHGSDLGPAHLALADRHNLLQLKSVCLAHLSMNFNTAFSDHAMVKDIPSHLWSEIMKAISDGQVAMTEIEVEEE